MRPSSGESASFVTAKSASSSFISGGTSEPATFEQHQTNRTYILRSTDVTVGTNRALNDGSKTLQTNIAESLTIGTGEVIDPRITGVDGNKPMSTSSSQSLQQEKASSDLKVPTDDDLNALTPGLSDEQLMTFAAFGVDIPTDEEILVGFGNKINNGSKSRQSFSAQSSSIISGDLEDDPELSKLLSQAPDAIKYLVGIGNDTSSQNWSNRRFSLPLIPITPRPLPLPNTSTVNSTSRPPTVKSNGSFTRDGGSQSHPNTDSASISSDSSQFISTTLSSQSSFLPQIPGPPEQQYPRRHSLGSIREHQQGTQQPIQVLPYNHPMVPSITEEYSSPTQGNYVYTSRQLSSHGVSTQNSAQSSRTGSTTFSRVHWDTRTVTPATSTSTMSSTSTKKGILKKRNQQEQVGVIGSRDIERSGTLLPSTTSSTVSHLYNGWSTSMGGIPDNPPGKGSPFPGLSNSSQDRQVKKAIPIKT
ncbi:hypothetical protein HDU76_007847 [Blyttiomyces sp. JEL0837]|nr:hypothetical protein HDU76_007847 [Blyttiomyces sp. JEL0837]